MALFCCTPLVPVQRGRWSLVESLRPLDIFPQTHPRPAENQDCISIQWCMPAYSDARRKESNTTVLLKHITTALIPLLRYSQPLSAVGAKKNSVIFLLACEQAHLWVSWAKELAITCGYRGQKSWREEWGEEKWHFSSPHSSRRVRRFSVLCPLPKQGSLLAGYFFIGYWHLIRQIPENRTKFCLIFTWIGFCAVALRCTSAFNNLCSELAFRRICPFS